MRELVQANERAGVALTPGLDEVGQVSKHNRDQIAQQVMGRVAALLPPAYRGVYDLQRQLPADEPGLGVRQEVSDPR